jgi:hypothetical protein
MPSFVVASEVLLPEACTHMHASCPLTKETQEWGAVKAILMRISDFGMKTSGGIIDSTGAGQLR